MAFDIEMIQKVYDEMGARIDAARRAVGRPLTLTEKILYSHLFDVNQLEVYERGASYVDFAPGSSGHARCDGSDGVASVHAGR